VNGVSAAQRTTTELALDIVGLRQRFGETVALDDVSFSCRRGEVVALIGENGAGKSTLVKILSGVLQPDAGHVEVAGVPRRLSNPSAALDVGISTVFQELSLLRGFSVSENLVVGREPTRWAGTVNRREAVRQAREILAEWDAPELRPGARAGSLSLAQQQRLEIVRALSRRPKVLLLDEPTSALGPTEVDWLAAQLEKLTAAGTTVVFISHRLGEVKQICDRLLILRNGKLVGSHTVGVVADSVILEEMIGHTLSESLEAPIEAEVAVEPMLQLHGVRLRQEADPMDLVVRPGEIVGVGGLEGQGQKALFDVIFGMAAPAAGRVEMDGARLRPGSVRSAVRRGIGLVPESRKDEGLFLELSVRDNASIASLAKWSHGGVLGGAGESVAVRKILAQLGVPEGRARRDVGTLSGGNQQKIVFAKWMLRGAKLLLLFDPTRGVDVGAKAEIFELMRAHARNGGAVLFFSSELEELVNIPNRVLVMYGSTAAATLSGAALTKTALLTALLGIKEDA
jgi:ribose transport system ATP-binding protein